MNRRRLDGGLTKLEERNGENNGSVSGYGGSVDIIFRSSIRLILDKT